MLSPPSLPSSSLVSVMLGLPITSEDLIQLGRRGEEMGGRGGIDMTGVYRYETDEQNVQQT